MDKAPEEHWRELSERILTDITEWRRSHPKTCAGYLGHPFRKSTVVDEGAGFLANACEIRVQSTRSILLMRSDRTPFS